MNTLADQPKADSHSKSVDGRCENPVVDTLSPAPCPLEQHPFVTRFVSKGEPDLQLGGKAVTHTGGTSFSPASAGP